MKEKLYRFMQGRYGSDRLNRFLMAVTILFLVLSFFIDGPFYLLSLVLIVYSYFRMFSKNIYKRRAENAVYLSYENKVRSWWATLKRDTKQRRTHHIYKCPSCKQKIRIPRGKGKIEIRCPKCNHTFIKRS